MIYISFLGYYNSVMFHRIIKVRVACTTLLTDRASWCKAVTRQEPAAVVNQSGGNLIFTPNSQPSTKFEDEIHPTLKFVGAGVSSTIACNKLIARTDIGHGKRWQGHERLTVLRHPSLLSPLSMEDTPFSVASSPA